jgi:CDGSH-type Zn-finger protein/ferredoxin
MPNPTVTCSPNGPYLVKGLSALRNSKGEGLQTKPVIALCRCGGSANKPFCDGSHKTNGFSDANLGGAANVVRQTYLGKAIAIHDDRSICAHAGFCTDGLAAVFNSETKPWINPDNATVDEIAAAVRRCPSGALTVSIGDVSESGAGAEPAIEVTKDGPYAVTGECEMAEVALAGGAPAARYTLCRCGASKNKPFCDGSHWDAGFKDERN